MFASNPSLSAMDHPIYDVWVIECKNKSTAMKSEKFSSEEEPETAPEKTTSPEQEASKKEMPSTSESAPASLPAATDTTSGTDFIPTPSEEAPPPRPAGAVPALEQLPPSFEEGPQDMGD
jgi:hypothetical protein